MSVLLFLTGLFWGNDLYRKGDYTGALEHYGRSDSFRSAYNAGCACYKLGDYDRALAYFDKILSSAGASDRIRFKSHFNAGNAYFSKGDYKSAVQSYENALNIKPYDKDARFNLELAKKMLEQKNVKQDPSGEDVESGGAVGNEKNDAGREGENAERPGGEKEKNGEELPGKEGSGREPNEGGALDNAERKYLKRVDDTEKKYRSTYFGNVSQDPDKIVERFDEEGFFKKKKDW